MNGSKQTYEKSESVSGGERRVSVGAWLRARWESLGQWLWERWETHDYCTTHQWECAS